MKVAANELLSKLKLLSFCLPKQDLNPVLSCFYFKTGAVEAYSGTAFGRAKMDCDFEGLVPSQLLISTLQALKTREVEFKSSEGVLKVVSGRFNSQISMVQAEATEFQEIAKVLKELVRGERLPKSEVLALCSQLLSSQGFTSPTYRNAFISCTGQSICTDGYRLFGFKHTAVKDYELPLDAILLLSSNKDEVPDVVGIAKDFVRLSYKSNEIEYIMVRQVVDKDDLKKLMENLAIVQSAKVIGKISVPDRLINIIERVQVVGSQVVNKACQLIYSDDKLTVRAEIDTAHSEDSVKAESVKPFEFKLLVNYEHLLSLLQCGIEGQIEYAKLDEESSVLSVRSKDKSFYMTARVVE